MKRDETGNARKKKGHGRKVRSPGREGKSRTQGKKKTFAQHQS